jgi:peptidoglycan/LPS O-acetylase OafA/YrhL
MTSPSAYTVPGDNRATFPLIDAVRAAAALMVLLYHVIEIGRWSKFPTEGLGLFFRYGWIGVNLFLVISGFVIGLTALSGYERQGIDFRKPFMVRRLSRLVPLYVLTCLISLMMVENFLLQLPLRQVLIHSSSHLLFLHNLYVGTHGSINSPTWSVALEMQFYLLMICITPWLARVPPLRMLIGAVLLAALYRWISTLIFEPGVAAVGTQRVAITELPGVLDHFAIGIFMAHGVRGDAGRWVARRLAMGWNNVAWASLAALTFLLPAGWLLRNEDYWSQRWMIVGVPLLLAAGLAAVVAAAVAFPQQRSPLLRPLRYLGEISYGIYLWHMPILLSLHQNAPAIQGSRLLLSVLLGTLLLAAFSWHLLEKPTMERYKPNSAAERIRAAHG